MKRQHYIIIIFLLPLLTFGQESIDNWVAFDSISIKEVKAVSLFRMNNRNEKILVENNKYNSKGQILENTAYCDFTYEPLDSVFKYLYFYEKDSITLKERKIINTKNDKIVGNILYGNSFLDDKLICKTIHDITWKDLEKEHYFYNEKGLLVKQRNETILFLGDTSFFSSYWSFEYDHNRNLLKQEYISDSTVKFSFNNTYDSHGNLLTYKFVGIHNCGDDIDRYSIKYNEKNKPIFKEIWNARGENWAYKYFYNKENQLIKELVLRKFPKKKPQKISEEDNPPPPPPMLNSNDFRKKYQKDYGYIFKYDTNGRLISIIEKQFRFKYKEVFLFEYK